MIAFIVVCVIILIIAYIDVFIIQKYNHDLYQIIGICLEIAFTINVLFNAQVLINIFR